MKIRSYSVYNEGKWWPGAIEPQYEWPRPRKNFNAILDHPIVYDPSIYDGLWFGNTVNNEYNFEDRFTFYHYYDKFIQCINKHNSEHLDSTLAIFRKEVRKKYGWY